jgi:hypothetical protein
MKSRVKRQDGCIDGNRELEKLMRSTEGICENRCEMKSKEETLT